MNVDPAQSDIPNLAQHVTTAPSTPLARFVPGASIVSDQTVDQWVEQELRRGRCRVRAGLAMLGFLAMAAVPVVLWF
jgi:hypothetical protein